MRRDIILISLLILLFPISIAPSFGQFQINRIVILEPIADSYVDSQTPTLNFGAAENLKVALERFGRESTSYLKFDVPSFDSSSFLGAKLYVRLQEKSEASTSTVVLYEVNNTKSWNELGINFLNAPDIINQTIAINDRVAFEGAWHLWDIAAKISAHVAVGGGEINFALKSVNTTGVNLFYSKDSNSSPYIELSFVQETFDDEPPIFVNISVEPLAPTVEDEIEIFAEVFDTGSGIDTVILQYIRSAEAVWNVTPMEPAGLIYRGSIPRQPSNITIFFFIDAIDLVGNSITSEIMSFNISRPLYYSELLEDLVQKDIELDNAKEFFEGQLAGQNATLQAILNATVNSLETERDDLLQDLEELVANYDILLIQYTRLGRDKDEIDASYARVLSLYSSIRDQYTEVALAFEGQRGAEEELRTSLDDLRVSYTELAAQYENLQVSLDDRDRQIGETTLISLGVAAGFGLLALTTFSLWYFGRKPVHS